MKDYYDYFNAYGPYWGTAASAAGLVYNSWKSSRAPYNSTDWKLPKSNITGPPGNTTAPPWNPDKSRRSPAVRVNLRFRGGGSRTVTEEEQKANNNIMSSGNRLKYARQVTAGRKKFSIMKMIRSNLEWTEQQLGLLALNASVPTYKHLVSEFNPGTGGLVPIYKATAIGQYATPMHVYDLNLHVGAVPDNQTNYPINATNQNDDINSRAWFWTARDKFQPLLPLINQSVDPAQTWSPRYYINDPMTTRQNDLPGTKVYRKGIAIDFNFYGCRKTYMEYDIRVIKILDKKYCPDYPVDLNDDPVAPNTRDLSDFKQNWQNMIRAWTINPLLKGIEPGPQIPRRWFRTVAKKRIRISEQSGDLEQVTAIKGRIYVNLNEVNDMAWDQKGFTHEQSNSAHLVYDNVPTITNLENAADITENATAHTKPHYRSRYYLVIRALCPHDQNNNNDVTTELVPTNWSTEGLSTVDYTPSYDLCVRTTYATLNGQV